MAYFVELDENNVVKRTLAVNDDHILQNGVEVEQLGIDHLKSVYGEDTVWKQTSFNNRIRVRFGQPGYTYNQTLDAFIPPKPFPSWVFNNSTLDWDSPIPKPNDDKPYEWNEGIQSWVEIKLPNS